MLVAVAPEALFIASRLVRAALICELSDAISRSRAVPEVLVGLIRGLKAPTLALPTRGRLGYAVDVGRDALNGE